MAKTATYKKRNNYGCHNSYDGYDSHCITADRSKYGYYDSHGRCHSRDVYNMHNNHGVFPTATALIYYGCNHYDGCNGYNGYNS